MKMWLVKPIDIDSDPDFVRTDESAMPVDVENEDSIWDFVGPSDNKGMSSARLLE